MLSSFGDIWIGCTYIFTSDWRGSCSEEGPLLRTLSRPPYMWMPSIAAQTAKRPIFLSFDPLKRGRCARPFPKDLWCFSQGSVMGKLRPFPKESTRPRYPVELATYPRTPRVNMLVHRASRKYILSARRSMLYIRRNQRMWTWLLVCSNCGSYGCLWHFGRAGHIVFQHLARKSTPRQRSGSVH